MILFMPIWLYIDCDFLLLPIPKCYLFNFKREPQAHLKKKLLTRQRQRNAI